MTWGAVAVGGAALVSGYMGSQSASSAANTTAAATQQAAQLQSQSAANALAENARQFNIGQQNLAPYLAAGKPALNWLSQNAVGNWTPTGYQQSPGYQWQLQQGEQALNNQLGAGGMRLSGRAAKEAMQYGQGLANQDYQQWWNNQMAAHQNALSNAFGLAGIGVGATNTGIQSGQNYANAAGQLGMANANALGNIYTTGANTQASLGMAGSASMNNAIQSGIGNYLGYQQNQNLMNLLTGKS